MERCCTAKYRTAGRSRNAAGRLHSRPVTPKSCMACPAAAAHLLIHIRGHIGAVIVQVHKHLRAAPGDAGHASRLRQDGRADLWCVGKVGEAGGWERWEGVQRGCLHGHCKAREGCH